MTSTPLIACIGIVGKYDNPLHISVFPPASNQPNAYLDFSFLLHASLDLFDLKTKNKNSDSVDQDLGLLKHVDERLSIWGWETGTGVRIAVVVDRYGNNEGGNSRGGQGRMGGRGVEGADMKLAFKALQTAYIRLLQNPFYTPDEHTPMAVANGKGKGGEIKSPRFIREVKRIGETWRPGMTTI